MTGVGKICAHWKFVKIIDTETDKRLGYSWVCGCVWRPGIFACPWNGYGAEDEPIQRTLEVL